MFVIQPPVPLLRRGSLLLAGLLAATCSGEVELPPPRPLVVFSGARIVTTPERMKEVDRWLRAEMKNIEEDPTFLIRTVVTDSARFPWETLYIEGDTASISYHVAAPEARTPYMIYSHLYLMERMGRLEEWLPDSAGKTGYELEEAILDRTADAWLYTRAIFDAAPHAPMDELLYARESGYLKAMILTARGEDFPEERDAWLAEEPESPGEYRQWFLQTFSKDPPGRRGEGNG